MFSSCAGAEFSEPVVQAAATRRSSTPGMARPFGARGRHGRLSRQLSRCAYRLRGRGALASRTLPATGTYDIWSFDFNRGTETRVTLDDAFTEIEGMMVPGGSAMVFGAARGRALRLMRRDLRTGRDERLMPEGLRLQGPDDVSPDGRRLAYEERTEAGSFNLWTMPLTGTAPPSQIRSSPFNETRFRFAPDGDHYTFVSDESGRAEVYVSRLSGGGKTVVSTGGGRRALDARRP
jgi:Tol biopolymer transport system component